MTEGTEGKGGRKGERDGPDLDSGDGGVVRGLDADVSLEDEELILRLGDGSGQRAGRVGEEDGGDEGDGLVDDGGTRERDVVELRRADDITGRHQSISALPFF